MIYTCPMHPEIEQDHPGNCPICGMTLEPKTQIAGNEEENAECEVAYCVHGDQLISVICFEVNPSERNFFRPYSICRFSARC